MIRMNNSSRKIILLTDAGLGLLIARAALPPVLTWLLNLGIRKIPGYQARVQRVNFHFAAPSLVVKGLSLAKSNGTKIEQLLEIKSVMVGGHLKAILTGSLIGHVRIVAPRLQLNLESSRRNGTPATNLDRDPKADPTQLPWQQKVKQFRPFRLTSAILTEGEIHLEGVEGQNGADIRIDQLNVSLANVTNSIKLATTMMAIVTCKARVLRTGSLQLRAQAYPLAPAPTFNLDFQTSNIDLTEVRTIIEKNIGVDVRRDCRPLRGGGSGRW
jgi:hypothetical protein